jgi:hypothetical protein
MCISFRPEYFWLNSAASSQRRSTAPGFLSFLPGLGGRGGVDPSPEGLGYCLSSLPGLGLAFTFGYAKKCIRIHFELSSGGD